MKTHSLKVTLRFLWRNRTRTFASIQGLLAVFIGATDIFTIDTIKWLLLINALLTYVLGQVNAWIEAKDPPTPPGPSQ